MSKATKKLTKEEINKAVEDIMNPKRDDDSFADDVLNNREPEIDLGIQPVTTENANPLAEVLVSDTVKKFESSREDMTVKEYLERFNSGVIKIPECQRMFVWTDKQVDELMNSIRANVSITELKVGEVDGELYLADGLQRTNALIHLAASKKLSDADRATLMAYEVTVNTTHGMDWENFNKWFYNCNNGTPLASSVKESAKLSPALHAAVMELSGHDFLRNAPMKKLSMKNDHKRVIAMSFLCSAAGLHPGTVAPRMCRCMSDGEGLILDNLQAAKNNLNLVLDGLKQLKKEFVEKAMSATYICPWGIVLTQFNNISADEIAEVTMRIFEGKKIPTGYSSTTGSGSGSKENVNSRAAFYVSEIQKIRAERTLEWESKAV